jgi:hypothetical protein
MVSINMPLVSAFGQLLLLPRGDSGQPDSRPLPSED